MDSAGKTMLEEIQRLKEEQRKLRLDKKQVAKDLKNAERRRGRLKKRAKLLSDTDLVAVLSLRQQERLMTASSSGAQSAIQDAREPSDSSSGTGLGASQ